jgi:photosystem II stability/assembly factor-like uncharacterized protein
MAPLAPGEPLTITDIRMIDTENGWAIGGDGDASDMVLRTEDGGETWKIVKFLLPVEEGEGSEEEIGFTGTFLDAQTAWITIDTPQMVPTMTWVWRTIDAGQTWELSEFVEIGVGMYYDPSMWFVDNLHGWFLAEITNIGAGIHIDLRLFRTTDSGDTWAPVEFDRYHITGAWFANPQTGWITEERIGPYADSVEPVLWYTMDGGDNWERGDLPEPPDTLGLFSRYRFCATYSPTMFSALSGALVVGCFDLDSTIQEEYIYTTLDSGGTWETNPYPGGTLQFSSDEVGWALGRDIYKTEDRGRTWTRVKTVNWDGQFSFVDDLTAWAVAWMEDDSALVFTNDGCQTWELLHPVVGE